MNRMSNRIIEVEVRDRSLDPAQAELWISLLPEHATPTAELRGRLTGPRCAYAATVEVAYPVKPFLNRLKGRVVIPEPCLWEPQCPFLYQGNMELWDDGQLCHQVEIRRGLRRVLLTSSGLRVNGRPLFLRGCATAGCDQAQASLLRRRGYNLLIASAEAPATLWELADRYGLLVLERMRELSDETLAQARREAGHPSCLGWLLEPPFDRWKVGFVNQLRRTGASIGVEVGESPAAPLPEGIGFVACPAAAASSARALELPFLLIGEGADFSGAFGRLD
jgi:hypothetical protein